MNDLLGDEIPVAAKRNQSSENVEDLLEILISAGYDVTVRYYDNLQNPYEVYIDDGGHVFYDSDTLLGAVKKVFCNMYYMGYIKWYPE